MKDVNGVSYYTVGDISRALRINLNTVKGYLTNKILVPDLIHPWSEGKTMKLFSKESFDRFIASCYPNGYTTEKTLSVGAIAKMFDVTSGSIYYYVRQGLLKPDKILPGKEPGKACRYEFKRSTVEAFVQANELRRGSEWRWILSKDSENG